MTRHNFTKATRKAAYLRSGGLCEARGSVYGLKPETRCSVPLNGKYDVDHWPIPATDEGSDTLSNAVCCCKQCHRWKTSHYDVPMQAKGRRIRRANGPVEQRRQPKQQIKTRPFPKSSKPWPKRQMRTP